MTKYLVPSAGTYNCRPIAQTNRLSVHRLWRCNRPRDRVRRLLAVVKGQGWEGRVEEPPAARNRGYFRGRRLHLGRQVVSLRDLPLRIPSRDHCARAQRACAHEGAEGSSTVPDAGEAERQEQDWAMSSHTLHVVQAFEDRDGGIVPVEPKACPAAGSARALAARLASTASASSPGHERAILNSATEVRRSSWFGPASSPMNTRQAAA
jgi:hypothetical protein